MTRPAARRWATVIAVVSLALPTDVPGQGIASSGIQGIVRSTDGRPVPDARVSARHVLTGFSTEVIARRGRFVISGLESGGPYALLVRHIGTAPHRTDSLYLVAGATATVDVVLRPAATSLDTVRLQVARASIVEMAGGGTAATIGGDVLRQLPTLNRDLIDLVRLVPHLSAKVGLPNGGLSAAGAGFRFNGYLVNGVSERTVSGSVPFAFAGGRSIPLDAVREYQVLLAPYDPRHGDFAGALVNTVTRAGDNSVRGTIVASMRNHHLAGRAPVAAYDRQQVALSLGGPIVRDRAHYFLAVEDQRVVRPAAGPYLGQRPDANDPVPVGELDLAALDQALRSHGLTGGSAGAVRNGAPLASLFARVDIALPEWNSRVIGWQGTGRGDEGQFTRAARDSFSLSSYAITRVSRTSLTALQVLTNLPGLRGAQHEFTLSHRIDNGEARPPVDQPLVRVTVPGTTGGLVTVNAGANAIAHGGGFRPRTVTAQSVLSIPGPAGHALTFGASIEGFRLARRGLAGAFGTWSFASVDSLQAGVAARYELPVDFGSAGVALQGRQFAVHVGDRWIIGDNVVLTYGVRADGMHVDGPAPYNRLVDSLFGRRTDASLSPRLAWSPRAGITWDLDGARLSRVRGGIGVFASRPPLAWLHSALTNYGTGIGSLACGTLATDRGAPPAFTPDHLQPPDECAGGQGVVTAPTGNVNLVNRNAGFVRTLRASLAWDRQVTGWLVLTGEALSTRGLTDIAFVNLNLLPPSGVDAHGRVLHGTISPFGVSTPAVRAPSLPEVVEVRGVSRLRAWQWSTSARVELQDRLSAQLSYAFTTVRDAQTPVRVNTSGRVAWASARAWSGDHRDLAATTSGDDLRHRMVMHAVWRLRQGRWGTTVSMSYVGESGRPFTYLAWGASRLGDLNADGSNANDPVYLPVDAYSASEIAFSGRSDESGADNSAGAQGERVTAQRAAYESFIRGMPCLRSQRGRIMARNSCREPASHTTLASVRQQLPLRRGVELQVDVFNLGSLLRRSWGNVLAASPTLLEHVGQLTDATGESLPVFRFNPAAGRWTKVEAESAFQVQVGLRYAF